MRSVSVIGVGCTPIGVQMGQSVKALAVEACRLALADAGATPAQVDALYLGNFASGMLVRQELLAAIVAGGLGLGARPATKVEGACASGGIAIRHAHDLIAFGCYDAVLVAGVEKMTTSTTEEVTAALSAAVDQEVEGPTGLTFPGFFAAVALRHMHEYGTSLDHLAAVAVKNRQHAQLNPRAQFRDKPVTLEQVSASRLVADPLRLFDCCPISDGAAAALLVATEKARQFTGRPVTILGSSQATGSTTLQGMASLTSLQATVVAARQAFHQAGVGPEEIQVAEVHDCFTIAELVALEDLGLLPRGEAGPRTASGETRIGGKVVVNPSGGLLSKGHPVGATGLTQLFEVVQQLRGQADNQVPQASVGLLHNVGGAGGISVVHILGRG